MDSQESGDLSSLRTSAARTQVLLIIIIAKLALAYLYQMFERVRKSSCTSGWCSFNIDMTDEQDLHTLVQNAAKVIADKKVDPEHALPHLASASSILKRRLSKIAEV